MISHTDSVIFVIYLSLQEFLGVFCSCFIHYEDEMKYSSFLTKYLPVEISQASSPILHKACEAGL